MILPTYTDFRYRFTANTAVRDRDGWPVFDYANMSSTPITLPTQLSTFSFPVSTATIDGSGAITVNAGAADAVSGVDEWDWYLTQQSDDPTKQYLTIAAVIGRSGSVRINLSALGTATWNPTTTDNVLRLVFDVGVYARRRSDGRILFGDLMRSLFAKY